MTEIEQYSEDGANLLIANGWLVEQPHLSHPGSLDKKMH